MRKIKKITSIFLAVLTAFSMTAVAVESVAASVDANGYYVPGSSVKSVNRYYFAMPNDWLNEYTDSAGVCWYSGTDSLGSAGISYPGYKAKADGYKSDTHSIFYTDCPSDVQEIRWNNFFFGGNNPNDEKYMAEKSADYTYADNVYDDSQYYCYDNEFFKYVKQSYNGDKSALGAYKDNFYYDSETSEFCFCKNNMIFVLSGDYESNANDRPLYYGNWFFYYGNGEYGTYPTKADAAKRGILKKLSSEAPAIDDKSGKIYFDAKKSGWNLDYNNKFYCHIWAADGSKTSSGTDWPAWQTRKERCNFDTETGIATYDLSKTGHNFKYTDGKIYTVIFSSNTGRQTYNAVMSGYCIGDTLYCTDEHIESPEDSEMKCNVAVWENNPDCGPERCITSTGNIIGTAYHDNESDESLLAEFLIRYSLDAPDKLEMYTQQLIDEIKTSPDYMLDLVYDCLYLAVEYGEKDKKTADAQYKVISEVLQNCSDPTEKAPSLTFDSAVLGVGEKTQIKIFYSGPVVGNEIKYTYDDVSDFKFSSDNKKVATVDSKGNVKAIGAGNATITVTGSNGKSSQCKITVKNAPSSVKVAETSYTFGKGDTLEIRALTNSGSWCTDYQWSSSNTKVVTVGTPYLNRITLRAVGTGTATVTVKTYNGKTASCKVTVRNAPSSIKINPASVTLGVGEKLTVSESTNSGSYAHNCHLIWKSSNDKVVTVVKGSGNKAELRAVGTGTADITITTYNKKTASCRVTVKPAPTSVKTNPTSVTLGKGETYTISESTDSGSYANAANLKWSSTNTKVATVTKGSANKATIKAMGVGTAYIKITLYNGKTAQCKVTVKNAPSSVSLSKTSLTLNKGASYTISEYTNRGTYANAANLKWTSSNSSVATVTKGRANKAVIKAKAKGTAYIKITLYNGKTAQCKVTVK